MAEQRTIAAALIVRCVAETTSEAGETAAQRQRRAFHVQAPVAGPQGPPPARRPPPRARPPAPPSLLAATVFGTLGGAPALAAPVSIDVGTAQPVVVDDSQPIRIALFIEIGTNSAVQATVTGAKAEAAKHNIQVDVFDARFDIARQVNQMQNALNGRYNAWIVAAIEGQQVCNMAAVEAPKHNVVVAVVTMSICGHSVNEADRMWSPGTLTYVGGNEAPSAFEAVMLQALKDRPGPLKVGLLTGQPLHPITKAFDKAVADIRKQHPEFEVAATYRTDYSPEMNQQKTQAMLLSHPDVNTIIGVYTNMSKGVVPALEAAGKLGQVNVYENGGTSWSVEALQKGWIKATTGYYRASAAATAVRAIADAWAGKPVARAIMNDGHPLLADQGAGKVAVITSANVAEYTPQSP